MNENSAHNPAVIALQFVIFLVLAAVLFVLFKANINSGWDKITLGLVRSIIAGAVYSVFFFTTGRGIWPENTSARFWLCVSAFCKSTSLLLMMMAFELLPASYIGIVLAFGPLGGMVISHLLFHDDPLTPRNIVGMCISIVGIVLLVLSRQKAAEAPTDVYLGTFYIFCSMIFGGLLPNSDKKAISHGATIGQTAFFSVVPVLPFFLILYVVWGGQWPDFNDGFLSTLIHVADLKPSVGDTAVRLLVIRPEPIVLILVMSVVAIFIMPLRRSIIGKIKISTLCMLDNIQPMDNVIFAALFLGEKITSTMILCMLIVLSGVTLARAQRSWLPFKTRARDINPAS